MLQNFIVDINTTGAAKTPIEYTISMARTLIKDITSVAKTFTKSTSVVEHATEHAALHISTKNLSSAVRKLLDISMIGAALFNYLVQKSYRNSDIQIFNVILWDINIALASKNYTNPATKLLTKYYNFLVVFSRSNADILLKHMLSYDYVIELIEGKTLI